MGYQKACTVPSVIKSITRLTGIGSNVQVKRKYKTNAKGKVVKWWYTRHAEKVVLKPAGAGMGKGTAANFMEA